MHRSARLLDVPVEPDGTSEIASRSRGTPRIANRLLRRVRDFAQVRADGVVTLPVARQALELYEVDESGLDRLDLAVLDVLCSRFGGGPVGVSTLAVAVGEERETVEEVAEPFLVRMGLLARTPRGRVATPAAWRHLGLAVPAPASRPPDRPSSRTEPTPRRGRGSEQGTRVPVGGWVSPVTLHRWPGRRRRWPHHPRHLPRSIAVPELASTLLPLLAIFVVFWLLIIRPQQRRQKALQQLRSSLQPGDQVMLTSGIYATLRSSDGDRATVEIAPGVVVDVASAAIASVESSARAEDDDADSFDDDDDDVDDAEPTPTPTPTALRSAEVANASVTRAGRTLIVFFAVLGILYGLVALAGSWKPALGLDLQGGTRITLVAKDGDNSAANLEEARRIIDQRVNGSGVTEAEVTTQGNRFIVVEVPGETRRDLVETVKRQAQLRFRVVAQSADGTAAPTQPSSSAEPTGGLPSEPVVTVAPSETATPKASKTPKGYQTRRPSRPRLEATQEPRPLHRRPAGRVVARADPRGDLAAG